MLIKEAPHSGGMCTEDGRLDLGLDARCVMGMKPFSPMCLLSIEG